MATLQTKTTKGAPLTVIYPAEKPVGYSAVVRLRVGKKTVLPAFTDHNLPHLVQFQKGQRIVMFMLSDVLQSSYWERVRNAYNVLGQLDIDDDAKLGLDETGRVVEWLREQSQVVMMSSARRPAPPEVYGQFTDSTLANTGVS